MIGKSTGELEQARRLERGLVVVRWFGVALGVYLISQTNAGPPPYGGLTVVFTGQALMGVLATANLALHLLVERLRTARALRRLGLVAFAFDATVIFSLAWLNSYDPHGSVWVVIYILPLEGALRYGLEGALASVAATFFSEIGREAYLATRFAGSYDFLFAAVILRVGVQALVALVAGFMARSLAREAENAAEQARRFQEAARRESLARRELAAFNTAILTGVAVEDLEMSIQLMASAVGRDLGFETFAILLREDDELTARGMYGMPFFEGHVPIGTGVTGTVAATGKALLVPDVSRFPGYISADDRMRCEMSAPLRIGDEVIGVVDVESRVPGAFDDAALGVLTRLADQIALVIHGARLHARQKETLERLRELDQMKSDFVAIASHELRTPLTAIHGYVTTLARRYEQLAPEEVQRFLETISRQSERMNRLVQDLLVVSRIEAGRIRIDTRPVDLRGFLEGTLESLGPHERSRVELEVDSAGAVVEIDPDRVDQILRNLIGNALKFSPRESPVLVRAAVDERDAVVSVTDRGIGIAPEELPHVFERFHQASAVLTRQAEGAGLGLFISKRLVDAMGGSISVTSAPGRGSTFELRLPVAAGAGGPLGDGRAQGSASPPPGDGAPAAGPAAGSPAASRSARNTSTRSPIW